MAIQAAKKATVPLRTIIKIHVKFLLNTPDGLRRVGFELSKDTQGAEVLWRINFQLYEREKKADPFGDAIVDLAVDVDAKLNSKAEKMAEQGMTPHQAAYVLGPAADTVKDAATGKVTIVRAKTTVQHSLKK